MILPLVEVSNDQYKLTVQVDAGIGKDPQTDLDLPFSLFLQSDAALGSPHGPLPTALPTRRLFAARRPHRRRPIGCRLVCWEAQASLEILDPQSDLKAGGLKIPPSAHRDSRWTDRGNHSAENGRIFQPAARSKQNNHKRKQNQIAGMLPRRFPVLGVQQSVPSPSPRGRVRAVFK